MCMYIYCEELATEVDHIVPLVLGGREFREDNLQAFCHAHHVAKTLGDQKKIKSARATVGWGA